jgi:UDP-N-acetylmuramate dehydrogenase
MLQKKKSLREYNTFGINVHAKNFKSASNIDEILDVLKETTKDELFILGGGSNLLLTSNLDKTVLHINTKGIKIIDETNDYALVKCEAGENWHNLVLWCIENNLGGIENLSLIPGNAGTSPIQNIGAYGVEIKDVLEYCEALNIETLNIETFTNSDCKFSYRESVFKQELKGKYIITSIVLKLSKKSHRLKTSYGAIEELLKEKQIIKPTIKEISDIVIEIRQSKLPDPKKIGNSGSFFKNPVVSKKILDNLSNKFENVPSYKVDEYNFKIPAGWLIETAGFKGLNLGTHGVHHKQALVLVNYGEATGKEIYYLSKTIQEVVFKIFGIKIASEVNIF